MTLLTDDIRRCIGAQVTYPASEPIGAASPRYYAMAVRDENPAFWDEAAARAVGLPGCVAPTTFIVDCNFYTRGATDESGYFGHQWDIPGGPWQVIRGGNDYQFARPIVATDRISVSFTLSDIEEKATRQGGSQLMLTSLIVYRDDDGEEVARNTETIFLRQAPST